MKILLSRAVLAAICLSLVTGCTTTVENPEPEAWPIAERTQAHINLGKSYLKINNLDAARVSFNTALEVNPKSSDAYLGLGLVEAKALNLDLARNYLSTAVRLDFNNIPAINDYAVLLCKEGPAEAGVALLEKHIKDPSVGGLPSYLAYGRCYEATGKLAKARQAYEEVLKIEPLLSQALLSMAYISFEEENYLSSSAFVQRYLYTNTISSDALLLAAQVEDILNNPEERDYYTQMLWSRYPRSEQAKKARELFSQ